MKFIKETNYSSLKKGDIISIQGSLEVVTTVKSFTFYSAPVFELSKYKEELWKRSSHWVGSLDEDDIIIIFNDIEEVISYLKDQISNLKRYYKCA